jgi:hypothetical protein
MTDVTSDTEAGEAAVGVTSAVDDGLVAELVARAQAGGVKLTGEGGLLQQLTKRTGVRPGGRAHRSPGA